MGQLRMQSVRHHVYVHVYVAVHVDNELRKVSLSTLMVAALAVCEAKRGPKREEEQ